MQIIRCDRSYAGQILAILNHAILTSTALYDYKPRTMAMMQAWFDAKANGDYPIIGVVDDSVSSSGQPVLMGFGSYGPFRNFPAYKYTVEHSVYVAEPCRGRGLGRMLLERVIAAAEQQQYHVLVGGIDSQNQISIGLHRRFGFEHAGTIRHAGFKFGRWLDLVFYQRILSTPSHPTEA